jgi:hypothetical protein
MRSGRLAAVAVVAAVAGCVQATPVSGGMKYGFVWYIPVLLTFLGLGGLLLGGLLLLRRTFRGGLVALVLGLIGLAVGTNMFFDKAVVDDTHFELRTGFWFAPTRHSVNFADVTSVQGVTEEKTGRRGRKSTNYYLVFVRKSGTSEKVPLGDLMRHGPTDQIVSVLTKKGIPVTGTLPTSH